MIAAKGYAAQDPKTPLGPFSFDRREPGPHDVQFDITVASATPTSIRSATNGAGRFFRWYPATRLSAA